MDVVCAGPSKVEKYLNRLSKYERPSGGVQAAHGRHSQTYT